VNERGKRYVQSIMGAEMEHLLAARLIARLAVPVKVEDRPVEPVDFGPNVDVDDQGRLVIEGVTVDMGQVLGGGVRVFLYAVRAAAQARGVEEKEVLLELLREAEVDVDLASAVGDSTTDTR
jgi:hypothetical protein